jgi:hypothetical protein
VLNSKGVLSPEVAAESSRKQARRNENERENEKPEKDNRKAK